MNTKIFLIVILVIALFVAGFSNSKFENPKCNFEQGCPNGMHCYRGYCQLDSKSVTEPPNINLSKEYYSNGGCLTNNCHFGFNTPVSCSDTQKELICTMEFTNGDNCGQYVQCSRVNGECTHITNPEYDYCISCSAGCHKMGDITEKESCVKKCEEEFPGMYFSPEN